VEAALPTTPFLRIGPPYRKPWYRRALVWTVLGAVAAAAIAGVVIGTRLAGPVTRPGTPPRPEVAEPLEVASDADVHIVSMDGDDVDALVTGEPPLSGPLVLASPGEVTLTQVKEGDAGTPPVRMEDGPTAPMIWVGGANAKHGDE
jgi:hypothetical protein